nr:unnamed protein product [Digitaria exilis]
MAGVATARDVEEVIEKLHSDRARVRDEGVKLLGTWLQGHRAASFCRLLGRNTARGKPGHGHLTGAATWPFLILALLNCVKEDISGKKRGATKSTAARMLRIAIQCAEDVKLSGFGLMGFSILRLPVIAGHSLLLISVARQLFGHVWEVVKDSPSFQLEYSMILRQLLAVKEYRYQMKPRTYSSFVAFYMKKVAAVFDAKFSNHASSKDESFRCTLTLHVLLENPPGDYPDIMREDVINGFIAIFSHIRQVICILSLFITYAKVQLKLARAIPEILEKLVDIIIKELDKNANTGPGFLWCEAPRDEKAGSSRCFQEELMDLSATVFYLAHKITSNTPNKEKRLKKEHIMDLIIDGLSKGSLFWSGSVCFLIQKYGYRVDKPLLISWFEASCKALRSVMSHANAIRFQDSILWLLRAFKEFLMVLTFNPREEAEFCLTKSETDSALVLLGGMIVRDQVHTSFISEDTWNLQIFKQLPSPSALYFIACYFSRTGFQGDLSNSIFIRKNLLRSTLELVHSKEFSLLNEQNVVLIPEAIFSLCAAFSSSPIISSDTVEQFGDCKIYCKSLEDESWVLKDELLYSVEALSEISLDNSSKVISDKCHRIHLPGTIQQPMLLELMDFIKGFVASNDQFQKLDLSNLVFVCSLLCNLVHCALLSRFATSSCLTFAETPQLHLKLYLPWEDQLCFCFLQNQDILLDLVNKATELSYADWFSRIKLIDCISSFIFLFPDVAQDLIGCLLDMLHDTDYRVLSDSPTAENQPAGAQNVRPRQISGTSAASGSSEVLLRKLVVAAAAEAEVEAAAAETEVEAAATKAPTRGRRRTTSFNDELRTTRSVQNEEQLMEIGKRKIRSTIGAKMVAFSINSPVTAREVLAVGPQPVPVIETALITLAHLSVHSEDVEVECVFMISAAAAIQPSQRELVYALFDSISRRLGYSSRSKYLGHVMGPILFRWVACGMSLVSLVEVQEMFGYRPAEPKNFVEHCSSWLLPFLILRGGDADLNWISKILSQPLSLIIKRYFVQIFGLSIAARCGTAPEKDLAETALCESLLQLGEISEVERDDLIKKHMVSIVAFLLSISSSAHGPQIPYFSKEIIALAVKMVVDGFVDTMDDDLTDTVVIDKINIFRPDRVFKVFKICYIICIVGNYIQRKQLQGQCCNILSKLLASFDGNSSAETVEVLGRQLQVVVPTLLNACLTNEKEERSGTPDSSRILSLLQQLTVDADPLLYDYIRELEPLPDLDCLKDIREFHTSLSVSYASRDQFLKGILSTAKGLNVLQSLDSLDRSLLMVHSRGVNIQIVEQTILGMEKYSSVSLEDSDMWQTDSRTYKQWLCTLVSSLICHCDDIILRLCRSLVFLKVKAAELLLASTLVNIAGNVDSNAAICRLVSTKVEKIIFSDSNQSLKSIHLFLDALNVIRSFYVAEKARTCPSNPLKVYWLSVDYLVAARAASLPPHVGLLVAAFTRINEPDSIYGITLANEITSQIIRYEHEGDWSGALEYYDLLVRSSPKEHLGNLTGPVLTGPSAFRAEDKMLNWKMHKGLMRSLQKTGCSHVLNVYCEGLTHQKGSLQQDAEFIDIQYEAAWRAGNWDFSFFIPYSSHSSTRTQSYCLFNENLHSCLRSLENGDSEEFHAKLCQAKTDLVLALSNTSKESTKYIHSTILKLQMLDHVTMVWDLRWNLCHNQTSESLLGTKKFSPVSTVPTRMQLGMLDKEWNFIMFQTEDNLDLYEPFLAFRRALLKVLGCEEHLVTHLFQSASALRKLEEAKLLRAQGQHDMAISLGKYILQRHSDKKDISDVYRLVGKWLAETRSSNSRTIIEDYLRPSVDLTEFKKSTDKRYMSRQCRTHFHMAHYTYSLFKSYEERLSSNEWQAALRLRKYKARELETLIKRLKSSSKARSKNRLLGKNPRVAETTCARQRRSREDSVTYRANPWLDDRDNFLNLALQGYQHSLVFGGKYDLQVVFRLVSLWFSLFSRDQVVKAMMKTTKEIALASLLKKMAIDHPYHTIFQLLALANGDRVKDKQRSRSSFVVDMEKKLAAENLLKELSSCHGALICQMKQMVEIYIKLAELETKKEDTNKRIPLPREVRSICQLELVPVVTATIPVDPSCRYEDGSFPHFSGLADSIMIMNGINAPKVIECFGSDGNKYRQLAKSGNDDLRQDAVVPFTPSAGVVEWVNGTVPLGDYLLGSTRISGAHGRYGTGDWTYLQCREYLMSEKDKRRAFLKICNNFRPVMHHFFLERFLLPADWFQSRLAYTRSVAASSMVGYIVGLGDRHSMNILIDQDTAEVVHIDLGVAFEQGLMLKTPERVPFRLTRDIIDGMGVTGVEGVFRRCCEKTVSVMRANKEALLTIIEVFIHDPLYKWALSPLKALQRQKDTDYTDSCLDDSQEAYEGNKDAARAILRIKQKLDGYEDGEMRSVQGQVQQLIQDAVDVDRLCQMFPGWGPWL